MSGDDELRRRRKRRALRVPVDEVPRRSAVSGFPPAPREPVAAVAAPASIPIEEVEELDAFEEITSELDVGPRTALTPAPNEEVELEPPSVDELEVEPEVVEALGASATDAPGEASEASQSVTLASAEPAVESVADASEAPDEARVTDAGADREVPADAPTDDAVATDTASAAGTTSEAAPPDEPQSDEAPAVVVVRPMLRVSSMPPPPSDDFEPGELADYLADDADEGLPPLGEEPTRVEEAEADETPAAPVESASTASDAEPSVVVAAESVAATETEDTSGSDRDSVEELDPALATESGETPTLDLEPEDDTPELTIEDDDDELDDVDEELDLEEHEAEEVAPAKAPAPPVAASASEPEAKVEAPPRPETKPRRRPWFETFFNDDYLRTVRPPKPRDIERECDFITARLNLAPGATILDVGCGLGLHAIELTRRGYLVVGLDLSLPMLSRAGDEAQDQGLKINFLHADMREMNFDGSFDAVLCWGTTFGYFDDDSNKRVVERLHRALKPRGVLLLDVVNRDHVIRSQPNLIWFEGDGCICMEESKFNYFLSRLEVKRTVMLDDGRQRDSVYTLRSYALHELGLLLHQQGFRVAEVSGMMATPGVFFGADSPRILVVAERRVDKKDDGASRPPPPGSTPEG